MRYGKNLKKLDIFNFSCILYYVNRDSRNKDEMKVTLKGDYALKAVMVRPEDVS